MQNAPQDPAQRACVIRRDGRDVPYTLSGHRGHYHSITIKQEEWLVHRSRAGVLEFIDRIVGAHALTESGKKGVLIVPRSDKSSWIGTGGGNAGFLRVMLGLKALRIAAH